MKINIALILAIIVAIGVIAFIFTAIQISTERQTLNNELEAKTVRTAEDFYKNFFSDTGRILISKKKPTDSIINQYRFVALIIYYSKDSVLNIPDSVKVQGEPSIDFVSQVISADSSMGKIIRLGRNQFYEYVRVAKNENFPGSAVIFFTDANYIEHILKGIWLRNFFRWFLQALVISVVTLLIIRWGIFSPINKVIQWVRDARTGDIEHLQKRPPTSFLEPLYKEISGIAKAMQEAKAFAQEEARLRTTAQSVWTAERLNEEMKKLLQERMMIVVSNREPYMHVKKGKELECIVPASGMVTAMEPILKACGGLWIASGTGEADRDTVDEHDKVQVPPYENKYTLRRIWLTKEQEHHFYYGFSNEGLWPLCHIAHTRPVFRKRDWDYYCEVNEMYANAVLQEIENTEDPFILIQDYHFALLPQMIKAKRPDARVAIFWHIPWPNPESFGICPWQKELLMGMLGADLVGFHTQYHCNNFLETISNSLEARVIWENFSVKLGNHFTMVNPFPISIAFTLKDYEGNGIKAPDTTELLKQYGISAKCMCIGVERIDYTKGLIEKFLAVERFLDKHPSYIGKFTLVQIGAVSRALLKAYSDTVNMVETEINRINWKFKTKTWQPILFLKGHHSHEQIMPFYRAADLCMVTSLHDGMNLVAKEFIASRCENDGVLILSRFAGASQELYGAIVVNPYGYRTNCRCNKACY